MKKVLVVIFCAIAAFVFADKYDKWLNDEVKVIITQEEKDAFKKLKTDAEKDQFIQQFWARRDPTPGTPENEYQKAIQERLQVINEKMKGSGKNALDTDMSQTFMLLGDPTKTTVEEGEPPKQTWIYDKLPKEIASGQVQIRFEGNQEAGGYDFADAKQAHEILDKARAFYAQLGTVAQTQAPATQTTEKKPAPAPAPAVAAVTTPELKSALDATAAGNPPKDIEFQSIAGGFMTSTGEDFITVAATTAADASAAKVVMRVQDASGTVAKEGEWNFSNPNEAPGYFQAELPGTPGEKTVLIAVVNGGKAGGAKHTVTVPDSSAFSMSSIILAKEFKQLTEPKPEREPYTFGKIKVQPNITGVFTKSDELILTYEVYNSQIDSATGKPNLEVVYSFQKDQDKPKQTPPAPPNGLVTGKKMTIPTSFPLEKFPVGQYKLTVTITDKASNQSASREAAFSVQ